MAASSELKDLEFSVNFLFHQTWKGDNENFHGLFYYRSSSLDNINI